MLNLCSFCKTEKAAAMQLVLDYALKVHFFLSLLKQYSNYGGNMLFTYEPWRWSGFYGTSVRDIDFFDHLKWTPVVAVCCGLSIWEHLLLNG